jgi:chemotaxis protein MotB
MSAEGVKPLQPIRPDTPSIGAGRSDARSSADAAATPDKAYAEATREVASLERLRRRIERVLAAKGFLDDVAMKIDERGLSISLVSRHIVFRNDVADLSRRGQQVLDALAPVIRSLPNQIDVDGHTNQVKVKPKYYATDWELSAARAITVLRHLQEHGGVSARRMSAVAYGHERPLRDPALPGAAALNTRVDLVVLSAAPEAARKLFQTVLRDRGTRSGQGT